MTFKLEQLGSYRIERTRDWGNDSNKTFGEMIRVKESKPKLPYFDVPSHLYKFSEKEIGIYLKDHKNLWRKLGKLLNDEIDLSGEELMVHFSISLFPKIVKIVQFVRKRSRKTPLSDGERDRASHLRSYRKDITRENDLNFNKSAPDGKSTTTSDPSILTARTNGLNLSFNAPDKETLSLKDMLKSKESGKTQLNWSDLLIQATGEHLRHFLKTPIASSVPSRLNYYDHVLRNPYFSR